MPDLRCRAQEAVHGVPRVTDAVVAAGLGEIDASGPYQTCEPLSAMMLEALEASILAYGVKDPVHVDENFDPIDGHHRRAICRKHGLDYPVVVDEGLTDEQKRDLNRTLNADRRQMTATELRGIERQRRGRIAAIVKEQPGESDLAIARMIGVSNHTVARVRQGLGMRSPEARRDSADDTTLPASTSEQDDYQEKTENHADHRRMVIARVVFIYPAPNEGPIRRRDGVPYDREDKPKQWDSREFTLTGSAPESLADQQALFQEAYSRAWKLSIERPFVTVKR